MKVKLPSYLQSANGRIGDIVFYNRRNRIFARRYVKPVNPDTVKQRAVRKTFADAVSSWLSLSPEKRAEFGRKARRLNMSGYNLYISKFMKDKIYSAPDELCLCTDNVISDTERLPLCSVTTPLCINNSLYTGSMPELYRSSSA